MKALVTGAGGTIGFALIEYLISQNYFVIAIDSNPSACEIIKTKYKNKANLVTICADIRSPKINHAFIGVGTVFHLAAIKDIVHCEVNPLLAIETNIIGTKNVLDLAFTNNVSNLVFSSSDKAANPTNILGLTKLLGEQLVNHYANIHSKKYYSVRLGNVLGSSGSIIPKIMECIKDDEPIGITDLRMTRFIMTIGDAVNLMVETLRLAQGGEIFIKKMKPVQIFQFIRTVWGMNSEKPFNYKIIGIRPKENIHEDLIGSNDDYLLHENEEFLILSKCKMIIDFTNIPIKNYSSFDNPSISSEEISKLIERIRQA